MRQLNRKFSWFVENDIVSFHSPLLLNIGLVLYLLIMGTYIVKEVVYLILTNEFNWPRNFLVCGTFLSWYFGIAYFNGDMAFTTLNVISHGIPYMALIWIFEKQKQGKSSDKRSLIIKYTFSKYGGVLFFVLLLALFAYIEEGVWDGMIWKEHGSVFTLFSGLPKIGNEQILSLLAPLLALPQSTHYVLDGFIWKIKKAGNPNESI